MNSRARKQTLTVVAVLAVVCMLVSQLLVYPQRTANAAGTDLYVGYTGKANNFSTVQDAVNRAASLNPSSENDRVTIHIAPGTYRQQVVVQTPYITFVNDEPSKGDAILTWYYGIGYKYYSANSKGYYDASLAASKSGKNVANYRWGATVQLWPKATNFKAKNIVFENSFNRYITDEELADGVECTNETLTVQRYQGVDVKSKAYTERAAALSADTSYCEFLNCQFLSSQDTLYTGGAPQYYKNCLIEGQTDYIFGGSNAVFDGCELRWKGYSSGTTGGYITAARSGSISNYTGYLFYNCNVTGSTQLSVTPGYLGRPWGQDAKVLFVNTTLQNGNMIRAEGWYSMSGVQPETVDGFKENGTKLANGTKVDLSQRKGHTVSDSDAANINIKNYMNNWTPAYINGDSGGQGQQGGTDVTDAIKLCGGWFEEAFAEWDSSKLGSNIKVSYALSGTDSYTAVDSQLIRGSRVDIPGLKGNTKYDVKVEGSNGAAVCTITTMTFDRSGYAHYNYEGVGAYNDDGTLKSGVTVIYVTNSNKDTVTWNGKTGLYNIFNAGPSNVDFRLIGSIDVPSGAKANDGQQNDGSNMLYLNGGKNVTIEGIGYDANLNQWGFDMKHSTSCEVRNLFLSKYPDDGISMSGGSSSKSSHMWVHNNTIEKGYNAYAGNGIVDDDKAEGDGSTDIKWTDYVTVSYNVYKDCHKTSLVGGGTSHEQDWITYHHNWFNNTESRNPRARKAHVHSYNNYFSTNKQYGIGASYNSKVFSEANYYEKTNLPLDAVNMGSDEFSGTIKSYNDKFDSCTMGSGLAYKIVYSRNEAAQISNLKSGGEGYDNFDLNMYSYTAQTADQAKTTVIEYAGRMQQKAYNAGSVSQGQQGSDDPPQDNYPKSELISRLETKDASYGFLWSIAENVKVGDKAFADREHTIASLPFTDVSVEHILTACDSKKTDSDLAVITAAKDITVYVALDNRVTTPPSWLDSFTRERTVIEINDGEEVRPFGLFSKELNEGEALTLGTNGMSGACMNYTVFVIEKAAETTTTTTETTTTATTTTTTEETTTTTTETTTAAAEETTTTTTTTPVADTVWGDANLDEKVTIADAVAILQHLGNKDKYGLKPQGLINADVCGNGDGITAMDAFTIQQVDAGIFSADDLPVK
ncbi:MAG: hypothetical protein IKP78_11385 [Ruminococcus sp.]|nr:hypothetical protein [Ruminococcus sp.]